MPTLWIGVLACALAAGLAGLVLLRARRVGRVRVAASGPVLAASVVGSGESAPGGIAAAASDDIEAPSTRGCALESERALLQQLCAAASAGAAPAPGPLSPAQRAAEAAAVEVLARIGAHPRYTPRRPQLLPQLTRAINDPASSAQSIAAILAQDPALAGNLLRIANSALYRRRGAPVEQLERAVTRLGTEGLRQAAMAALLQPVISDDGSVFARCASLLWEHGQLSANIAIRPHDGARRDDLYAAQLLALLHALGSVVVVQVLRDAWSARDAGDPQPAQLVSLLETWSLRCACAISADWGLSARVRQALDELAGDAETEKLGELARTLCASRAVAAREMVESA